MRLKLLTAAAAALAFLVFLAFRGDSEDTAPCYKEVGEILIGSPEGGPFLRVEAVILYDTETDEPISATIPNEPLTDEFKAEKYPVLLALRGEWTGPITPTHKPHGKWRSVDVVEGTISRVWFWYGEFVTEGEWHLRRGRASQ